MSDREIITVAVGGFGTLAATQWANGLSQFEVENSNCVFHELSSRKQEVKKAVRAVFLDHSYSSSIKEEIGQVENVEQTLHSTVDVNPSMDVLNIFGADKNNNNNNNKHNKKRSMRKSKTEDDSDQDDDEYNDHFSYGRWPKKSATAAWSRHDYYDEGEGEDEEEEEEEEHDDDENNNDHHKDNDDDKEDEDVTTRISKRIRNQTYQPPRGDYHHPWWQYLTAPHRGDLDRVVSFMDLPNTTDTGGWSQLRSFGYGYFNSGVHAYLENGDRLPFLDNLRKEIECCDHLQGVQLFVDSDSVFGGIASYVSSHVLSDEFGFKRTMAVSCFPDAGKKDPLVKKAEQQQKRSNNNNNEDGTFNGTAPGASMLPETVELLLEDNRNLNRGLATSILAESTACYIPHEILSWDSIMKAVSPAQLPGLRTDDDIATASIVATYQDSILMPCRGITSTVPQEIQASENSTYVRQADTIGIAGSQLEACSSNFSAAQFMELLRPSPSMKLQSAYLALPFMHLDPASSMFKSKEQLLREQQDREPPQQQASLYDRRKKASQTEKDDTNNSTQHMLFNILNNSAPLVNMQKGAFRPLSGVIVDSSKIATDAHQVIAHSYTIRAGIPWLGDGEDHRKSMREALIEYTMNLRCPNFVGYAIREPIPLSGTFPKRIFAPPIKEKSDNRDDQLKSTIDKLKKIKTISAGAHAMTTHSAGTYLRQVHQNATRKNMHRRGDARARELMSVDVDSWRELEEDLAQLTDQYYFEGPDDNNEVDESDD